MFVQEKEVAGAPLSLGATSPAGPSSISLPMMGMNLLSEGSQDGCPRHSLGRAMM